MTRAVALVTLDGSPAAESIVPVAATVAAALQLRVVLLELAPHGRQTDDAALSRVMADAHQYLAGVAAAFAGRQIEVECRCEPGGDDLAADIARIAAELDAALIMIATHGRAGPARWLLGSVADAVIRVAPAPVLVLRAAQNRVPGAGQITRIMVALDGSEASAATLPHAARLAAALGATLDLVRVLPVSAAYYVVEAEGATPESANRDREAAAARYLTDLAASVPPPVSTVWHVLRGAAAPALEEHAERSGAGLVVMSTHGRSGVRRITLGSVSDRLVRESGVPVLLVRQ